MSHLNENQLSELKANLLEQQKRLRAVLDSLNQADPTKQEDRLMDNADPGTDATESNDIVSNESLSRETEIMLARTEEALSRMESGTYGHAADGVEIPFERLRIDPTVTTNV